MCIGKVVSCRLTFTLDRFCSPPACLAIRVLLSAGPMMAVDSWAPSPSASPSDACPSPRLGGSPTSVRLTPQHLASHNSAAL